MVHFQILPPCLQGLSVLSAEELTNRLEQYIDGSGGFVTASEIEVARECVRRARKAERLERLLAQSQPDGPRAA